MNKKMELNILQTKLVLMMIGTLIGCGGLFLASVNLNADLIIILYIIFNTCCFYHLDNYVDESMKMKRELKNETTNSI